MFRRFCLSAAFAVAVLATSLPAHAALTSVNPTGGGGDPSLTSIMNTLYGAGTYNRIDDNGDQIWWFTQPSATLDAQVRYAGDVSSLGFYLPGSAANSANYTRIADITGDGFSAVFSNASSYGSIGGGVLTINGPAGTPPPSQLPSPFAWGFNDTNRSNYWSSEMGQNNDPGANGGGYGQVNTTDHMVTFFVNSVNFTGYVIAYEDLSHGAGQGSDRDFNDAVIQINGGVTPTPEPSTLAIAGLGGLGLIGYGIRRRRNA